MTAEYCTSARLTASIPEIEDENPPRAAELFREAGLAIVIPLAIAFLITLGIGIT